VNDRQMMGRAVRNISPRNAPMEVEVA